MAISRYVALDKHQMILKHVPVYLFGLEARNKPLKLEMSRQEPSHDGPKFSK